MDTIMWLLPESGSDFQREALEDETLLAEVRGEPEKNPDLMAALIP